jgi:hypothetical protein
MRKPPWRSPSRSRATLIQLAVLAGLAAASVSGCSGSGSGGSSSASGASSASRGGASPSGGAPSPSASPEFEDASADEILAQSRSALLAARSVHAKGVVENAGTAYSLDLRMVRGVGAAGSVASQGRTLGVLRIGKVAYVQPDAASWRAATGSDAAARTFAGKYLKVTDASGSSFTPFLTLTDVQQTYGAALSPSGTVTKGPVTTLRGRRVIDLRIDGGASGDVFVAVDGTPYPLRLAYGPSASQRVDFDRFGAKVVLTAPPASKVVAVPAH